MLAGVALVGISLHQATGHPKTVDSRGTVDLRTDDLLARSGGEACLTYGGHIHPNGVKCCSAKCANSTYDYCGATNCQNQGPRGVLNCCDASVPLCGVHQAAPCILRVQTTTTTTVHCRDPTTRCETNYFGISDATSQVCCDRDCGEHCGRHDCEHGTGGEAMCCVLFIRNHSVSAVML